MGLSMLNDLVALMEEIAVAVAYTQHLNPQGNPRGDSNDSTASAIGTGLEHQSSLRITTQEVGLMTRHPLPQGHAALACAQSRGSSAMLTLWGGPESTRLPKR